MVYTVHMCVHKGQSLHLNVLGNIPSFFNEQSIVVYHSIDVLEKDEQQGKLFQPSSDTCGMVLLIIKKPSETNRAIPWNGILNSLMI